MHAIFHTGQVLTVKLHTTTAITLAAAESRMVLTFW